MSAAQDSFPILEVPASAYRADEPLGTKTKFWFYRNDAPPCLFKVGRPNEDWSEKVAAELAVALGIPAARVDLAVHDGTYGVVSQTFLRDGEQLFHGNELLLDVRPDYPQHDRYHVGQHTVAAVFEALDSAGAAASMTPLGGVPDFGAADQFVGYLMLDALVANTDRHHENWAVVQRGAHRYLAPSYDHASSLGRNEREARIEVRLSGRDPRVTVERYVEKGRSAFFSEPTARKPDSTLEAFRRAARLRPAAGRAWAERLSTLSEATVTTLLAQVPAQRISQLHRAFAGRIIEANRARVLEAARGLDVDPRTDA